MVGTVLLTDEQWAKIDKIPGWLTRNEADLLYELCQSPWCEIGCWRGRSASVLALKGAGWAVDHFENEAKEEFLAFTKELDITLLASDFRDAANVVGEVRLLHLDADHSYQATKSAFNLYAPKLARGGFLVIHDAWPANPHREPDWPGTHKFVLELMMDPAWVCIGGADRSAAFRKP